MQDIGYDLKQPENGDKAFWTELEKLFLKAVQHTHDGNNSPTIDMAAQGRQSEVLAGVWVNTAKGWVQNHTVPAGVDLSINKLMFKLENGGDIHTEIHPTIIPISILKTNIQSILFQTYGAIKILIITSNARMIGTISIAERIKENPEIHIAEKPKPLNPLIIEAINTVKMIKNISTKLS